jgi:hypothetical protein
MRLLSSGETVSILTSIALKGALVEDDKRFDEGGE